MSQLKRLYDAQDWDALADCLAVHTQAIVARGGRGYSQLRKLSPEDLQNAATDVAIYHLEDPKHWRALVSSCGGSNDPDKEAKSVERYVATAMWRAFAKAVTPASHNVMHRYIRDAILSDESGPFKSDGPVYGLAGWTDAETMGVYKGVWSEFANPDAAKTFAQFEP